MKIPSQSLDLHSLLVVFGQAPDHDAAGDEADRAGQNVGNEPSPEEPEDGFEPEGQKSQRARKARGMVNMTMRKILRSAPPKGLPQPVRKKPE